MKREAERSAASQYGESNLLPVLASKKSIVQDEMAKLFPHTKPLRGGRQRHDWDGSAAGRRAADMADIGQKRMGGNGGALNR